LKIDKNSDKRNYYYCARHPVDTFAVKRRSIETAMLANSCDRYISRMDHCPGKNLFTIDRGQNRRI